MVGDVSTVDGHNTTPNQFDTTWSVFDRLISYDSTLQPQPELAESWDLSSGPAPDQAQPAQGRAMALGSRVHQRRCQLQPAARSRRQAADPDAAQPEQLVHHHRAARQVHGRPDIRAAPTGDVRLLRVLQHRRQGHRRRSGRQVDVHRHRSLQAGRVGPGRSSDVRQESELLALGAAVYRQLHRARPSRPGDAGAVRGQGARRRQGRRAERLRALPRRCAVPARWSATSAATTSCSV